jgi:hypothetical protein
VHILLLPPSVQLGYHVVDDADTEILCYEQLPCWQASTSSSRVLSQTNASYQIIHF